MGGAVTTSEEAIERSKDPTTEATADAGTTTAGGDGTIHEQKS